MWSQAEDMEATPEYGVGLENVLVQRKDRLIGILNGIDVECL